MTLHEKVIKYDIDAHGKTYSPDVVFGLVCPECYSTNIDIKPEEDGSIAVDSRIWFNAFVCSDCGCEFHAHESRKLTKAGEIAERACIIFIVLSCIALLVGIGGTVYGCILDNDTVVLWGGIGMVLSFVTIGICARIFDNL